MNKINRVLDPSCKYMDLHEVKIKYLVDCMKKNLPNLETCVYVLGSRCREIENQRTIDICKEIGKELAQVANINIVTNGFYGSSDIVALTFVEQRKSSMKESNDSVIHIVPIKDNKDFSKKCRQDKDGNFEKVTYGQTYFLGESIKERDSVIARLMDTCILIDCDQGEQPKISNKAVHFVLFLLIWLDSAPEIEEFIWNDHFVVPVCSSEGATSRHLGVPQKIFSCPNGVRESEWATLSKPDVTSNEVAKAVVHVICDLKNAIHEHAVSKNVKATVKKSNSEKPLKKRTAARKPLNININNKVTAEEENNKVNEPSSPEKVLPIFNDTEPLPGESYKGLKGKISRMLKQIIN